MHAAIGTAKRAVLLAAAMLASLQPAHAETVEYLPYSLPELAERARAAFTNHGIDIIVDTAQEAAMAIITGATRDGTEVMLGLTQKEPGRSKLRLHTVATDDDLEARLIREIR